MDDSPSKILSTSPNLISEQKDISKFNTENPLNEKNAESVPVHTGCNKMTIFSIMTTVLMIVTYF